MRRLLVLPLLVTAIACLSAADSPARPRSALAPSATRILYTSDWSGAGQIYSVDTSGRRRGQLTFGRAPLCPADAPCGFGRPIPAPDGRWLLFSDGGIQETKTNLYVARADGSHRRLVGRLNNRFTGTAVWSPDSRRIAYTRADGVHIVGVDGSGDQRVSPSGNDASPAWSPDGGSFAFVRVTSATLQGSRVVVIRGRRRIVVGRSTAGELSFDWSPTGAWIAVSSFAGLSIVHPDGTGRRRITGTVGGNYAWSSDGRSLSFLSTPGLEVADIPSGSITVVGFTGERVNAWSPRGQLLAFDGFDGGIRIRNAAGRVRVVSEDTPTVLAWSPDSRMLAYITVASNDLKVVTLAGEAHTLVSAAGDEGGWIAGPVWTQPPAGLTYRPPEPRSLASVTSAGIEARWPVERLAADGPNVAYVACGHTFAWTPGSKRVVQSEPIASLSPNCPSAGYYTSTKLYGLALAGSRLIVATVQGGNGRSWWMGEGGIQPGILLTELGHDHSTNGGPYSGTLVGDPSGSGDLLVFGSWLEAYSAGQGSPIVTTSEKIMRADPGGCPCQTLASSPGPLIPFDVDAGRIVAGGDNATWLLDANGTRLLTLPVSPRAAQLSGDDLVVLVPGELRDYDARSGAQLHAWPLPDVSSGHECSSPSPFDCSTPRLVLGDAARGIATYILDGQVHVIRLTDGKDAVVDTGSPARFMDAGLVYADGSRISLVPYDRLPL